MTENQVFSLIGFSAIAAAAVIAAIARTLRADSLLKRWAARNNYRIAESDRRGLFRGPFFLTSGSGQEVYRVTIEDSTGRFRGGYVRFGSRLVGMLSKRVDVRWDPEPPGGPGFPVVMPNDRGPKS